LYSTVSLVRLTVNLLEQVPNSRRRPEHTTLSQREP
jgi:hypothetical protein